MEDLLELLLRSGVKDRVQVRVEDVPFNSELLNTDQLLMILLSPGAAERVHLAPEGYTPQSATEPSALVKIENLGVSFFNKLMSVEAATKLNERLQELSSGALKTTLIKVNPTIN